MGNICFKSNTTDNNSSISNESVTERENVQYSGPSPHYYISEQGSHHHHQHQHHHTHTHNITMENQVLFHPAPGVSRTLAQLTEEEQIKIATRMGLLTSLPLFKFEESKREKLTECIICMCEYDEGQECRYLPCLHTFHRECIDDWLIRSFTCPSCLDDVGAVLLSGMNVKNKNPNNSSDSMDSNNGSKKRRKSEAKRTLAKHGSLKKPMSPSGNDNIFSAGSTVHPAPSSALSSQTMLKNTRPKRPHQHERAKSASAHVGRREISEDMAKHQKDKSDQAPLVVETTTDTEDLEHLGETTTSKMH